MPRRRHRTPFGYHQQSRKRLSRQERPVRRTRPVSSDRRRRDRRPKAQKGGGNSGSRRGRADPLDVGAQDELFDLQKGHVVVSSEQPQLPDKLLRKDRFQQSDHQIVLQVGVGSRDRRALRNSSSLVICGQKRCRDGQLPVGSESARDAPLIVLPARRRAGDAMPEAGCPYRELHPHE